MRFLKFLFTFFRRYLGWGLAFILGGTKNSRRKRLSVTVLRSSRRYFCYCAVFSGFAVASSVIMKRSAFSRWMFISFILVVSVRDSRRRRVYLLRGSVGGSAVRGAVFTSGSGEARRCYMSRTSFITYRFMLRSEKFLRTRVLVVACVDTFFEFREWSYVVVLSVGGFVVSGFMVSGYVGAVISTRRIFSSKTFRKLAVKWREKEVLASGVS